MHYNDPPEDIYVDYLAIMSFVDLEYVTEISIRYEYGLPLDYIFDE